MILVVDDDRMMRALIDRTLRAEGYQVVLAAGMAEARQLRLVWRHPWTYSSPTW
jgi:DNA-binding response OmpR family regulator